MLQMSQHAPTPRKWVTPFTKCTLEKMHHSTIYGTVDHIVRFMNDSDFFSQMNT